jgi:hypothetical protein
MQHSMGLIPSWRRRCIAMLRAWPLLMMLLAGCQGWQPSREEWVWQSLHAVDVAQTLAAADDACYEEAAPITRHLIGAQPSTGEVLAWGAGMALGHAWVSALLERHEAPVWVQKTWSFATITGTGLAIATNHREGVRVFGANEPVPGCS